MALPCMANLLLVRHARSTTPGLLAGQSDVAAVLPPAAALAQARHCLARLGESLPTRVFTSPALRCRQTAQALLPDVPLTEDTRLWEQNFGAWEGREAASLPDLGPLSRAALAAHRPPGGESFLDLAARAVPALQDIAAGGSALIVAHAGTVRAALGLALGDVAQALVFEVAPFSATLLRTLPGGDWSIGFVNLPLLGNGSP